MYSQKLGDVVREVDSRAAAYPPDGRGGLQRGVHAVHKGETCCGLEFIFPVQTPVCLSISVLKGEWECASTCLFICVRVHACRSAQQASAGLAMALCVCFASALLSCTNFFFQAMRVQFEQNQKLCFDLLKRGPDAFHKFVKCLFKSRLEFIGERLLVSEHNCRYRANLTSFSQLPTATQQKYRALQREYH